MEWDVYWTHDLGLRVLHWLPTSFYLSMWWDNRALLQKSCAQPDVAILHLGRGLGSSEELKDIIMHIPWGGTRILPQGCTIVSWLFLPCFCVPSLSWLTTIWLCVLEICKGQRGWMKPIFYDQEMRDTEMACIQKPHKALLGFKKKLAHANKSTQGYSKPRR